MPEAAGLLEITEKGVKGENNRPYVKVKIGQINIWCWQDICETPLADVEAMADKLVNVSYDDSQSGQRTYHHAKTVTLVPEHERETVTNNLDLKDRRITRTAIAKSCIESSHKTYQLKEAEDWFNWVWETNNEHKTQEIERSPEDIQQSSNEMVEEIKKQGSATFIRGVMDSLGYHVPKVQELEIGDQAALLTELKKRKQEGNPTD